MNGHLGKFVFFLYAKQNNICMLMFLQIFCCPSLYITSVIIIAQLTAAHIYMLGIVSSLFKLEVLVPLIKSASLSSLYWACIYLA